MKMRTVSAALEYLRTQDPDTCINEWWLRGMLRSGKIPHHRVGNRYWVDISVLENYLSGAGPTNVVAIAQAGKTRRVDE